MKKSFLFIVLFSSVHSASAEYRPLKDYAVMTYNALTSFIDHNPNAKLPDVKKYLKDDCTDLFKESKDMGYERMAVVRCAYCFAMDQNPRQETILQALKEDITNYQLWRDIIYWGVLGMSSFSTVSCVILSVMTGKMWRDFLRT